MIPWSEIQNIAAVAGREKLADISELEIKAFCSMLVTTIGLTAVNKAKDEGSCREFTYTEDYFSFAELPKEELLRHLEAGSGLPIEVCMHMLDKINGLILSAKKGTDSILVEKIGAFEPRWSILILDSNLSIVKPNHG